MRTWVQSLGLLSGLRIWHCYELHVRCRHSLDPALLWLWHRLAVVALIRPLAWKLPYATDAALKRQKERERVNRCRLLPLEWISNEILLCSTGNCLVTYDGA